MKVFKRLGVNENESENMSVTQEDDGANKPEETIARRGTIRSEYTEVDEMMNFDESSDDFGEEQNAPWVDNVRLRHGMDWLDLISKEVERETLHYTSLIKTEKTEKTA